ncbi:hypothetical protein BH20ACI4_BH20ACI4_05100 [soil metagenome]
MKRDNLKNNLNGQEILSADEQKISSLISGLEKVSAPKNFDFRLKARISAAKDGGSQTSVWRTLRFALPLTATVIIAAFVMIQGGLFSPAENQPSVVENPQREIPANSNGFVPNNQIVQTSNSSSEENKPEGQIPDSFVREPNPINITTTKNPVKKQNKIQTDFAPKEDSISSKDLTVSPSNINILPKGIPGNTAPGNKEFNQNNSVSAQEVLNFIGVETEPDGNKLRVKSVKENSLAGRSGVQTGDIVEAIDEQKLDEKNLSPKFKGGKTITVSRDNKVLVIELNPN